MSGPYAPKQIVLFQWVLEASKLEELESRGWQRVRAARQWYGSWLVCLEPAPFERNR